MSAFATPHIERILDMGKAMIQAGLPHEFVTAAIKTAIDDEGEGVRDLLVLWSDESEDAERDEIIADIQELIDDCNQAHHKDKEATYIRLDDLESIARDVRTFKDQLLILVHQLLPGQDGGITELAKRTHMPQPSLSRFFNTHALPRRGTLLKIAQALDLNAIQIAAPWARD